MSVHQKLGIILENKVAQKLKQENNVFTQKWSHKLIFLNEKNEIIIDVKAKSILTWREQKMVGVEINKAIFPTDFISIANAPTQRVKNCHDNATGEHNQPT